MAHFTIIADTAILDKGEVKKKDEEQFLAISNVNINDEGSLSPESMALVKKALSNEAVKMGATRINESDCVDISSGGIEASDDSIYSYNMGDIIITSKHHCSKIEKFMIKEGILVPSSMLKVRQKHTTNAGVVSTSFNINEQYKPFIMGVIDIMRRQLSYSASSRWVLELIELMFERSGLVTFSKEDVLKVGSLIEDELR